MSGGGNGLPAAGERLSGFEILAVVPLEEFRAAGVHARHLATGCRLFHVHNEDPDNLFSFTFKTPPSDNSGVAHILEHSVLCGSERFPVKDPFLQLLKGSMHTFMNAFTFPDKTSYPASSMVKQDFYNLFKVYGDAVFFPLLKKEVFFQEGHRLEGDRGSGLRPVGIVYNEMKGNYSTHESIASEWAYRSLFEGSPYYFDSGGEPSVILELSYERFLDFHRSLYHPSNCYIFLYGNLPTAEHLAFLQENFLSRFGSAPPVDGLAPMPRWDEPRSLERVYPQGGPVDGKSSVSLNWLLFPATDPVSVLSFEVLAEILLGNAGSPLQKALVESRLGEDLSPATGLESELLELVFSAGLRGTDPAKRGRIEKLVFRVLKAAAAQGLPADHVEGALRRVEFRSREIKAGANFGLRLMRRALRGWLHGMDPGRSVRFREYFDELKRRRAADARYFEGMIERWLLRNPHRTVLTVKPDPDLERRQKAELDARMSALAAGMSEADWKRQGSDVAAFSAFQEEADRPEALATIPSLGLEDIPRRVECIPVEELALRGVKTAYGHDVYTNGIVYADLAFNLDGLEPGLWPYLPLYAAALTGSGAAGKSYDRIALDLTLVTGGFNAQVEAGTAALAADLVKKFLFIRLKCLRELLPDSLRLASSILVSTDFADLERLRDNLVEFRNELKSSVIPSGHGVVATRAERAFARTGALEELWRGVDQVLFLSRLDEKDGLAELAGRLESIKKAVISSGRLLVNFTAPREEWGPITAGLEAFAAGLPAGEPAGPDRHEPAAAPVLEALLAPSAVGFVATSMRGALYGRPEFPAESVLAHYLKTGFLWERIRMKGGAYGAFASTSGLERVFTFASYRDPNISATLEAYRQALESVAGGGPSREEVKNAVIGSLAADFKPLSPSGKSIVAFKRSIYGITDELRQANQDGVLAVTADAMRTAAGRLAQAFDSRISVVLAGREALDAAAAGLPELARNRIELPV